MPEKVELISVGNELLIGKTLNTNAHWLSKRITSLGLSIGRITVVGDNVEEIAKATREALDRRPFCIITTGGLGPTFDDKTLVGIAEALNSKLSVNEEALAMVRKKYTEYGEKKQRALELTPARRKMAAIPEGAAPLPNPVGTAPGIAIKEGKVTVYALPGVPSEMESIFENSVSPVLREVAGDQTFFATSLYVSGVMESEMAPVLDRAMHDNPYVYIKSHPQGSENSPKIELHISTTAKDADTGKKRVARALMQLSEMVKLKGGRARTGKPRNANLTRSG